MTDRSQTAASLTRRAMDSARNGEIGDARQLLAEALHLDPSYEPAWMWFASVAGTDAERRFCLERAVEAKPQSRARAALRTLRTVEPHMPAEVEDLIDPPEPADVLRAPRTPRRKRLTQLTTALVLLVALPFTAWLLVWRDDAKSPVYLAFAMGVTGPDARAVEQMRRGADLFLDNLNDNGGIDGHPVRLRVFDDKDDPDLAKARAEEIVKDDRILAVIGHSTSGTSLAADPIYETAGVPVITPTSTADALTQGSPWTFSAVFTNSTQGRFIAQYLQDVLGEQSITVVVGTDNYATTLAAGVVGVFASGGSADTTLTLDTADGRTPPAAEIDAVASTIAAAAPTGTIVLALPESTAAEVVVALREAGVDSRVVGGDVLGNDGFYEGLHTATGDSSELAGRIYATAPMINDSLTGDAVRWSLAFDDAYGDAPTWEAATTHDALTALTHGLRSSGMTFAPSSVADDRERIRDAMAEVDSPSRALRGLQGPLWFGPEGDAVRPVIVGHGQDDRFVSAPEQLERYFTTDPGTTDPGTTDQTDQTSQAEPAAGGESYQVRRIVTIGVNVNEVAELDSQAQTFEADFFLWLKYTGNDDAADLWFPNATDAGLELGDPVRSSTTDGETYRLYRVHSSFTTELSFRDFPFDEQNLPIEVQHRTLPASQVTFAEDFETLQQSQKERLASGTEEGQSIDALNGWQAKQVLYFQSTIGSDAALGDPGLADGRSGLTYSQFVTDITVDRDVASFLVKNLLPLVLLAAATYVSLFFSHSQTGTRVSFGITGILTGAVLLTEVTKSLPNVGYTVAIEWAYYAFIMLSVACVLVGLIGDRLWDQRRLAAIRRLDILARLAYPLACLVIVGIYLVDFG